MRTRADAAQCFNFAHCGNVAEGNYREVIGWERRRARGGGHGLLRGGEPTGKVACDECGYKLARGIPLGQGSLFES